MLGSQLKPAPRLAGAARGAFFGGPLRRLSQSVSATQQPRRPALQVQASGRKCELTGKKANNGYNVTFSHKRNKKLQHVNLHSRSIYWPEGKRFVKLRVSTQALRTLEKKSLQAMAKEVGLDLWSLPYTDASPGRLQWLAEHSKGHPAQPSKVGSSRRMKNAAKLAASKKKPLQARYLVAGKVFLTRDPRYVEEYRP